MRRLLQGPGNGRMLRGSRIGRLLQGPGIGRLLASAALALALSPAAAVASTPPASVPPASVPPASPPPELVAFERQAEALHVNSVSFSALYEVSLSLPSAKGFSFTLPIEGTGEMSLSSQEGFVKAGIFGQDAEARIVGHTTYVRRRGASEPVEGRPWVRETHRGSAASIDPLTLGSGVASATTKGQSPEASAAGTFAGLVGLLDKATAVTEVGPEIVNGSQATEFAATLAPSTLFAGLSTELRAHMKKLGKLTAQLYVFFAPDGLPVRTSWTVGAGAIRITASIDILATEVPVSVKAPPADRTIGAARYKRLEAAKKRREAAQRRRVQACLKSERLQRRRGHRSTSRRPAGCLGAIVLRHRPRRAHVTRFPATGGARHIYVALLRSLREDHGASQRRSARGGQAASGR